MNTTDTSAAASAAAPQPPDPRYWVKSVARAIDIIELLAAQPGGEGLSVTEIGSALGLSKSAVFATLYTLTRRGLVADVGAGQTRRYRLGLGLVRLGDQAVSQTNVRDVARPYLEELALAADAAARLATLEDDQAVVIDQVGGNSRVRLDLRMGTRELPHSTGLGKAILAQLPRAEVDRIIGRMGMPRRTARTMTDLPTLLGNLAQIRQVGYALDDEEDAEGIFCIGAPIFGHDGTCQGAISITGLKLDQPAWRYQELGTMVHDVAVRISAALGHQPTGNGLTAGDASDPQERGVRPSL